MTTTPRATSGALDGVRGPITLADVIPLRRAAPAARDALLVAGGAALTAIAAQIAITLPWSPVPYTFQTAAVLLVGASLGLRRGGAAIALYVLAGALGLPVYAEGSAGIGQLLGITGGYLAGFVLAALVVGRLAELGWDRSVWSAAGLMLAGTLLIYVVGVPVLALTTGMDLPTALYRGAGVFLPWDIAKVLVAATALPLAWRVVGRGAGRR
ncbi:MAG: biotin transporter BioY [Chloroflexi bacterium]|nr:biotin transporter BioY [Chloroflexota bacterium]